MSESTMTTRVTLSWVPVTDAHGRVRLEMRWSGPTAGAATSTAAPSTTAPAVATHAA